MSDLPVFTAADIDPAPLDVASFDNDDAVRLGECAVAAIRDGGWNLAVRVVLRGDTVFQAKLGATGPGNDPWLAGKAAIAEQYAEPSLRVRRRYEEAGTPLADTETHRAHGGALPIRVAGEVVGTITLSGEPDVIDHDVASKAVRRFLSATQAG